MFKRCIFKGTFFDRCKMTAANFIDSDFSKAKLENCNAIGAKFVRCNLTDVSFKNTDVLAASFIDCHANGMPINLNWLQDRGALNADKAIIEDSVHLTSSMSSLSKK